MFSSLAQMATDEGEGGRAQFFSLNAVKSGGNDDDNDHNNDNNNDRTGNYNNKRGPGTA